jgi:EmrB/QacA subfamily drug resistance transporter
MSRGERSILILVSGAAFLDFLDVTVVNLAFPALSKDFANSSVAALTWVITGYALTFAALLAAAGRLADVLGRRRVFFVGLIVFTLASLASALAPSLGALIVARFVQGAGAAIILPSGLGIIMAATPPERRAAAVGIWGAAAGAAATFGPTVGGILVHFIDWRAIFFINIPLGIAILIRGRTVIPDLPAEGGRLPDVVGTSLLAAGIGLMVLGVTKAADWGWGALGTDASLSLGVAAMLLAVLRSRRHAAPAVQISLWRSRPFALSNLGSVFFGAGAYASMLISVLFLVSVWHYSELTAGLAMSPGAIAGGIAAAVAGRIVDTRGQAVVVIAGALICCLAWGYCVFAFGPTPNYTAEFLIPNLLSGIGLGMTAVGLSSAAALYVGPRHFAAATGLNLTARQIGGAIGIAVLAVILETNIAEGVTAYTDVYVFGICTALAAAALGAVLALRASRTATQGDAEAGVGHAGAAAVAGGTAGTDR